MAFTNLYLEAQFLLVNEYKGRLKSVHFDSNLARFLPNYDSLLSKVTAAFKELPEAFNNLRDIEEFFIHSYTFFNPFNLYCICMQHAVLKHSIDRHYYYIMTFSQDSIIIAVTVKNKMKVQELYWIIERKD